MSQMEASVKQLMDAENEVNQEVRKALEEK